MYCCLAVCFVAVDIKKKNFSLSSDVHGNVKQTVAIQ